MKQTIAEAFTETKAQRGFRNSDTPQRALQDHATSINISLGKIKHMAAVLAAAADAAQGGDAKSWEGIADLSKLDRELRDISFGY